MAANQARIRRIEVGVIVVCLFAVGVPLVGLALANLGLSSGIAKLAATGAVGATTVLGVLRANA